MSNSELLSSVDSETDLLSSTNPLSATASRSSSVQSQSQPASTSASAASSPSPTVSACPASSSTTIASASTPQEGEREQQRAEPGAMNVNDVTNKPGMNIASPNSAASANAHAGGVNRGQPIPPLPITSPNSTTSASGSHGGHSSHSHPHHAHNHAHPHTGKRLSTTSLSLRMPDVLSARTAGSHAAGPATSYASTPSLTPKSFPTNSSVTSAASSAVPSSFVTPRIPDTDFHIRVDRVHNAANILNQATNNVLHSQSAGVHSHSPTTPDSSPLAHSPLSAFNLLHSNTSESGLGNHSADDDEGERGQRQRVTYQHAHPAEILANFSPTTAATVLLSATGGLQMSSTPGSIGSTASDTVAALNSYAFDPLTLVPLTVASPPQQTTSLPHSSPSASAAGGHNHQMSSPSRDSLRSVAHLIRASNNIVVKFLPAHYNESNFFELFSPFGGIASCRLIRDRNSGVSLGYGFITYHQDDSAQKAVDALNGLPIENKILRVAIARPLPIPLSTNKSQILHSQAHAPPSQNQNPQNQNQDQSGEQGGPGSIAGVGGNLHSPRTNVYIACLPSSYTQLQLNELFAPYGVIHESKVLVDESGRSRGIAFVRFEKSDSASKAIQCLNGLTPRGGNEALIVKFARDFSNLKHMAIGPPSLVSNAAGLVPGLYGTNTPGGLPSLNISALFDPAAAVAAAGLPPLHMATVNPLAHRASQIFATAPLQSPASQMSSQAHISPRLISLPANAANAMGNVNAPNTPLAASQAAATGGGGLVLDGNTLAAAHAALQNPSLFNPLTLGIGSNANAASGTPHNSTSNDISAEYVRHLQLLSLQSGVNDLASLAQQNASAAQAHAHAHAQQQAAIMNSLALQGLNPASFTTPTSAAYLPLQLPLGNGAANGFPLSTAAPNLGLSNASNLANLPSHPHSHFPNMAFHSPAQHNATTPALPSQTSHHQSAVSSAAVASVSAAHANSVSLFVFHLPPELSDSELAGLFSPYGVVLSAKIMKNEEQESRGYGFINMANVEGAERAIAALNNSKLGNKFLKVQYKKKSVTQANQG